MQRQQTLLVAALLMIAALAIVESERASADGWRPRRTTTADGVVPVSSAMDSEEPLAPAPPSSEEPVPTPIPEPPGRGELHDDSAGPAFAAPQLSPSGEQRVMDRDQPVRSAPAFRQPPSIAPPNANCEVGPAPKFGRRSTRRRVVRDDGYVADDPYSRQSPNDGLVDRGIEGGIQGDVAGDQRVPTVARNGVPIPPNEPAGYGIGPRVGDGLPGTNNGTSPVDQGPLGQRAYQPQPSEYNQSAPWANEVPLFFKFFPVPVKPGFEGPAQPTEILPPAAARPVPTKPIDNNPFPAPRAE